MGPAGSQAWSIYVPSALDKAVVVSTFTPGNNITVTRIEAQALVAPSGCKTNAALQLSDGTVAGTSTLSLAAAANDSGALSLNYAVAVPLKLSVLPLAGCLVPPLSINVVVQYQGR